MLCSKKNKTEIVHKYVCSECNRKRCEAENCNNISLHESSFCIVHKCHLDDCNSLSLKDTNFCYKHKCDNGGCRKWKHINDNMCKCCREHLIRQDNQLQLTIHELTKDN